jgi:hypothetical protein
MASLSGSDGRTAVVAPTSGGQVSWSGSAWLALWTTGIVLALNLYAPAEPSLWVRLLGSAIIVVAAFATWIWNSGYDPYTAFVPFFVVIYSIHFALPVFILMAYIYSLGGHAVTEVYVEQALALALLGLICTLAGYYLVVLTTLRERLPKFRMQWCPQGGLNVWGYLLGAVGVVVWIITRVVELPPGVKQFGDLGGDLCVLGMLMLFFLQLEGRLGWIGKLYLWGVLLPLRTFLALGTGQIFQAMPPILALLVAHGTIRRRIAWLALLGGLFGFGLLQPFKSSFRNLAWQGGVASNRSLTQKAGIYVDLGRTFWQNPPPAELVLATAMIRLSHITELANVVSETPASVPYWRGDTYYPLFFKWIPRFLWEDKPKEEAGQAFGHRYNFIPLMDYKTAWNLPQLSEFYANFGVPGVIIGMFAMGLIYGCLQACFIHRASGIGAVVGIIFLLNEFFLIEVNTSYLLGQVFDKALMLALLNPLLRIRWTSLPVAQTAGNVITLR